MAQVLEREKGLLDRVLTMKPTERVERLKHNYLDLKNKVVIDILRARTRIFMQTEGEPEAIRQAKAFAATVRELPINIYPDELFVGWLFSEPHGSPFMPGQAVGMEPEYDTLATREHMPFLIDEETKRDLREEINPYWRSHLKGASMPSEADPYFYSNDPEKQGQFRSVGIESLTHWTGGFDKVVEQGLLAIRQDAQARLDRLDPSDPDDFKKIPFVEGAIIALDAAVEVGQRHAAKAREAAEQESDPRRKAELLKIAENCDRVPAHPATTFYEAVQSVWFLCMLYAWDNEWAWGISPGRADQYLNPYYEKDIEEGRITTEEAQELIDCFFMRQSQFFPVMGAGAARWSGPHSPGVHMDVGGLKPDGTDGTTPLSYMFLEARMHTLAFVEPTLGCLVHSKTPDALLIKASMLTSLGGGWPMFINQDLMVDNLLARGEILDGPPISLELARQGACIGCHEPTIPGMTSGWGAAGVNGGQIIELVLHNGRNRSGQMRGVETGDPRDFKTFEEFREAVKKQVAWLIRRGTIALNISEQALRPKVFTSSLTDDCLEKGLSMEEGGARYNVGAVGMIGTVDAGNSLAAIKRLVFEEEKLTMDQLCEALDKNFEGHAGIRKLCLEAPKFGNDDDCADEQVAWVTHIVTEEAKKYKTTYGGRKLTVMVPMYGYVPAGLGVGALPYGRLAGEPLADGVSPSQGTEMEGPTAVLKSVGKVNNAEVSLSQTLNLRVEPDLFEKNDGFKRLADLLRVFCDQKVDHLQINVVSTETLRAAQAEPEKYKELTVKVAGYNARFVEIHKELQDSIIARTEHAM